MPCCWLTISWSSASWQHSYISHENLEHTQVTGTPLKANSVRCIDMCLWEGNDGGDDKHRCSPPMCLYPHCYCNSCAYQGMSGIFMTRCQSCADGNGQMPAAHAGRYRAGRSEAPHPPCSAEPLAAVEHPGQSASFRDLANLTWRSAGQHDSFARRQESKRCILCLSLRP